MASAGACLAALLAVAPVGAQEAPAAAAPATDRLEAGRASFAAGLEAERAERWAEALRAFLAAGEVRTTAAVLFHIGLCHDRLGDAPAALTAFEAAWARAQGDGAGDVVRAVPAHLARLRPQLGRVTVRAIGGAGGQAVLDGRPVAADAVIAVAPGAHRAEMRADGQAPAVLDFAIAAGGERVVELGPAAAAPSGRAAPVERDARASMWTGPRVAGVVLGAAGALSLGGAAVLYAVRGNALDDVRAQCGGALQACPRSAMSDFDRGQTATTAGNIMLGVGAAALLTGGALFVLGAPPDAPAPTGVTPGAPGARTASAPSSARPARAARRPPQGEVRSGVAGVPGAEVGLSVWRSF
jgi:hypothetical protein